MIVVADHSKLGVTALSRLVPLSEIDTLITDDKADEETLREIGLCGAEIIVAEI